MHLFMSESFDVIVIGAGMAGASAAAEIAPHASVLLLETESRAGSHATGRSAALYAPGYGAGPVRRLTINSFDHLRGVDDEGRPYLKRRGGLFIGTAAQEASIDKLAATDDVTLRRLDGSQTSEFVPILKPDRITAGLYDEVAADIDVDLLHQSYLRAIRRHGGVVSCSEPVLAASCSGQEWRVETSKRELTCGTLVNAAGAWADEAGARAGLGRLGLQPKLRTAALIEAPADPTFASWPAVIDVDERFYFKPDAGLLLVSPADETDVDPHDAQSDDLALAEGIERILDVADIHITRAPKAWAGLRTFAPDRVPVIGRDPRSSSPFIWLAGQGGYGIQTAPAAARLAAAMVLGNALPAFADDAFLAAIEPDRLIS